MWKNALLALLFTFGYIFLLTVIFEQFINKSSNTLFTVSGIGLFFLSSYLYAIVVIKILKKKFS